MVVIHDGEVEKNHRNAGDYPEWMTIDRATVETLLCCDWVRFVVEELHPKLAVQITSTARVPRLHSGTTLFTHP